MKVIKAFVGIILFISSFNIKANDSLCTYFKEIVFDTEWDGQINVHKWQKDIKINYFGNPNAKDISNLKSFIKELNTLIPSYNVVLDRYNPDLKIYFTHSKNFHKIDPQAVAGNDGLALISAENGVISAANVMIATDPHIEQWRRKILVYEEVTQALGLFNDSPRYPKSIFHEEQGDNWVIEKTELSDIDKALIKMLYNPELPVNSTKQEFDNYYCEKLSI